jgi:hypothetical protein
MILKSYFVLGYFYECNLEGLMDSNERSPPPLSLIPLSSVQTYRIIQIRINNLH